MQFVQFQGEVTEDIICEDKFGGNRHLDHEDGELDSLAWASHEPWQERMSKQGGWGRYIYL